MNSPKKAARVIALLAGCLALSLPMAISAKELDSSIAACLNAWGDHPFGSAPGFKTLGTSVKVFGIGNAVGDTTPTSAPSLVLIEPSVNLLGNSTIDLMNPNGWYCLRTVVSIIGRVHLRANCKAHLASTSDGATVLANYVENRSIKDLTLTTFGSMQVERPCN